jgi:hypothetical protein
MSKAVTETAANERRIVLALARGSMLSEIVSAELLQLRDGQRTTRVSPQAMSSLVRQGLLKRDGQIVGLTKEGFARARRLRSETEPFRDQHMEVELKAIDGPDGWATVSINMAESPLAQLMRRKTADGTSFLTASEFAAGEKLRADYMRGQMMPQLGANWEAPISTGKRGAPKTQMTDAALAARQRVDCAIRAVGPELCGVLIDVCCYLKGLEQVESERRWPARSAKLILKSALGCLLRHYNPEMHRPRGPILSWGAPDYRPDMSD